VRIICGVYIGYLFCASILHDLEMQENEMLQISQETLASVVPWEVQRIKGNLQALKPVLFNVAVGIIAANPVGQWAVDALSKGIACKTPTLPGFQGGVTPTPVPQDINEQTRRANEAQAQLGVYIDRFNMLDPATKLAAGVLLTSMVGISIYVWRDINRMRRRGAGPRITGKIGRQADYFVPGHGWFTQLADPSTRQSIDTHSGQKVARIEGIAHDLAEQYDVPVEDIKIAPFNPNRHK